MPPDSIWATLGVAAPLVAILYYLLRQANEERKDTTKQFLTALTNTVTQSTEAMHAVQEAMQVQTAQIVTATASITTASMTAVQAASAAAETALKAVSVAETTAKAVSEEHMRMTAVLRTIAGSISHQSDLLPPPPAQ